MKLEKCHYSIRLLNKLKKLDPKSEFLDFPKIEVAIAWAKKYHHGQMRKSGEPFYSHPLEVAYLLSDYFLKTDLIIASILHDIVEDTEVTVEMIIDQFGSRIAQIVDRLTRDRPDGTKLSVEQILNNAAENNDKEVILIKVIDRLHNIQTIQSVANHKKNKKALETIDIVVGYCADSSLEKKLNLLATELLHPEHLSYLNRLYSKDFFSDNYQLPSLNL